MSNLRRKTRGHRPRLQLADIGANGSPPDQDWVTASLGTTWDVKKCVCSSLEGFNKHHPAQYGCSGSGARSISTWTTTSAVTSTAFAKASYPSFHTTRS